PQYVGVLRHTPTDDDAPDSHNGEQPEESGARPPQEEQRRRPTHAGQQDEGQARPEQLIEQPRGVGVQDADPRQRDDSGRTRTDTFRKAKPDPRSTMPSAASPKGRYSVPMSAANADGKAVHSTTRQ